MVVTGRTAAAAFLAVLLTLVSPAPAATALAADAAVVLLAVMDLLLAAPPRRLAVTRGGARVVRLGEPAEVGVTVANGSRRAVRGVIRDAWPPSAGAENPRHPLRVPAGERRRVQTRLVPSRRGDRVAGPVVVRTLGPLGLAGRQRRYDAAWQLRVLPPFESRRHLPERLARLRELDGLVSVRGRGSGSEFDTLREYVPGDDVRAIDWRATARRADVAVRTYRPERDRRVLLVLDTGRTSAARVGDVPRLDSALDAALLLAALAVRAGDHVDLLAHDRVARARIVGGGRTDVLASFVTAMATLEPALVETDARAMVSAVLNTERRRSLVVLFLDLHTAVVEEGLLPVLPALTERHLVLLAALRDPLVERLRAARRSPDDAYAAAAAERTLAERHRLAALLRRRGVEVVDAPPAEFAPAVADAYLALKAAGRL